MREGEYDVIEVEPQVVQLETIERANFDIQVATAKRYPRARVTVIAKELVELITMSKEIAASCLYALPRGGKPLTGLSAVFARIFAQVFGNIRAESKVIEITDKQVVSRGTAWDLEKNIAVAVEVRRSIWGKNGRYNEDMITVTGNAANAIAYRNAVLAIAPKMILDMAYKAIQEKITGDLSDENTLIARRKKALDFFNDEYGITEEEVVKLLGKHTVNQIRVDELTLLLGFQQSLKDGDTTVEDLLKGIRTVADNAKAAKDLFDKNKTEKQ